MTKIKIGDWVTSYTAGIWQVYRIIEDFYELRWNPETPKEKSNRVLVFSKRLCNSKFKRSFGTESCEITFIDPLDKKDKDKVIKLLKGDEKLDKAFQEYQPKSANLISGYSFSLPETYVYTKFESRIKELFDKKINSGLTIDDVNKTIFESELEEYKEKTPHNARIQLICNDHELKDGDFIFREIQIFNF